MEDLDWTNLPKILGFFRNRFILGCIPTYLFEK